MIDPAPYDRAERAYVAAIAEALDASERQEATDRCGANSRQQGHG